MMRKLLLVPIILLTFIITVGCENKHDIVEIYNKSGWIFDDIQIEIMDGFFYDRHEKFTVDENRIAVTIYFSKEGTSWE